MAEEARRRFGETQSDASGSEVSATMFHRQLLKSWANVAAAAGDIFILKGPKVIFLCYFLFF
ncbi:hypothetical protein LJC74_09100 [Eubacteriales bacterium OttesenSCG-928-A19]|nr:hypothetical protein [Eubacteriales bacterium OttesenSCG-928-A19]